MTLDMLVTGWTPSHHGLVGRGALGGKFHTLGSTSLLENLASVHVNHT